MKKRIGGLALLLAAVLLPWGAVEAADISLLTASYTIADEIKFSEEVVTAANDPVSSNTGSVDFPEVELSITDAAEGVLSPCVYADGAWTRRRGLRRVAVPEMTEGEIIFRTLGFDPAWEGDDAVDIAVDGAVVTVTAGEASYTIRLGNDGRIAETTTPTRTFTFTYETDLPLASNVTVRRGGAIEYRVSRSDIKAAAGGWGSMLSGFDMGGALGFDDDRDEPVGTAGARGLGEAEDENGEPADVSDVEIPRDQTSMAEIEEFLEAGGLHIPEAPVDDAAPGDAEEDDQ